MPLAFGPEQHRRIDLLMARRLLEYATEEATQRGDDENEQRPAALEVDPDATSGTMVGAVQEYASRGESESW